MAAPEETRSFSEMCRAIGKGPAYARRLQLDLGLHVPGRNDGYSDEYVYFMERVVSLRTFNVAMTDILDLFVKERRILEMLRFHSLSTSPTWYLGTSPEPPDPDRRLLLTNFDLGFPISANGIQANLDFSEGEQELFEGSEMGEDVRQALVLYRKLLNKIQQRVHTETPVLLNALAWSKKAFDETD